MSSRTTTRTWALAPVLLLLAGAHNAAAESMVTPLATLRSDAKIIVVGTLGSAGGGLSIDVEYALRGVAAKGPRSIKESPDGHVFVASVPAKNRVIGFLDASNRLRWVGRLLAGPSLEKGVIRLEGFYDSNAHRVHPGTLSLAQLRDYLRSGKLDQRYRVALAFADGKGGLRHSARSVRVGYDALSRNSTVSGITAKCLGHGRLQIGTTRTVSVFLHCRKRSRSLRLLGEITGVDAATGEILAIAAPVQPYLHEREFDRYLADPTATGVEREIEVWSRGKRWSWSPGTSLTSPSGRVHRMRGATSSRRVNGPTPSIQETRRFRGGVELSLIQNGVKPGWWNGDFFIHQLAYGQTYASCSLLVSGTRRSCKLKHSAAVWQYAAPHKRTKTSQAIAVQVAERFIVANGYTRQPPSSARSGISREPFEPINVAERLRRRHGTLASKAYGVLGSAATGWSVVFRYRPRRGKNRPRHLGRAVSVDPYGQVIRVEHQDFVLKHARRLRAAP